MKRPTIQYSRPCTFGELVQQVEYLLDPDDKDPMLFADDLVFGIFAEKFEEEKNGIVHYQEIRILRRDVKIPVLQGDDVTEEMRMKLQATIESWLPNTTVKALLEMLKKEDQNAAFETGIAHQFFPQYLVTCRKLGAIDDRAYLRLYCLPERPGSQGLEETKIFGVKEDGMCIECTDEKEKAEVKEAFSKTPQFGENKQ